MKTVHLTDQQYEDLMWAADEGYTQVFGYTNPAVDWAMDNEEFAEWANRVSSALMAARNSAE